MSCDGSSFDAQETEYALAATRTLQVNAATDIDTGISGSAASPQNRGFRFWNISPDAGQGMAYLSSPDGYCSWAVDVTWRNHTQTLYYRTGPANGVYVPVYYGATVYCQLVAVPADQVRQWNGIPIASTTPKPEAKGMFFKGMTKEPDFSLSVIAQATAPSDTEADLTSTPAGPFYPVMNASVMNVTMNGAGTLTYISGVEWDRGVETPLRDYNSALSCAGWSSYLLSYYQTSQANAVVVYSNRVLSGQA